LHHRGSDHLVLNLELPFLEEVLLHLGVVEQYGYILLDLLGLGPKIGDLVLGLLDDLLMSLHIWLMDRWIIDCILGPDVLDGLHLVLLRLLD
jgi:hypothetical protein